MGQVQSRFRFRFRARASIKVRVRIRVRARVRVRIRVWVRPPAAGRAQLVCGETGKVLAIPQCAREAVVRT